MVTNFKQSAIPQIVFGAGTLKTLPGLLQSYGSKVLFVLGKSSFLKSFHAMELFQETDHMNISFEMVQIAGEPSPSDVNACVAQYRSWQPNAVVSIGGGSVIDAGKAISAMLCENHPIEDYLEGIGTRKPSGRKIPFVAIPTTSGTGSEATKNAVITQNGNGGYKKSLRHDNYIPNLALIDPVLTVYCPPAITAASGLDALTQLLEAYLSTNSTPFTDTLAFDGLNRVLLYLETVVENGENLQARSEMSYAALLSGIALANAGLGVVHGFAQPLGSLFPISHGVVCGNLIGAANRITVQRLREESNQSVLDKYAKVARILFAERDNKEVVDRLLDKLDEWIVKFQLPRFSTFGVSETDIPNILRYTDLKSHPVMLSHHDLTSIIRQRL